MRYSYVLCLFALSSSAFRFFFFPSHSLSLSLIFVCVSVGFYIINVWDSFAVWIFILVVSQCVYCRNTQHRFGLDGLNTHYYIFRYSFLFAIVDSLWISAEILTQYCVRHLAAFVHGVQLSHAHNTYIYMTVNNTPEELNRSANATKLVADIYL